MIKVFQLITSIQLGGAENVALSLSEEYGKSTEIECVVVELFKTNSEYAHNKKNRLQANGIKFYSLGFFGKRLSLLVAPFVFLYYYKKEKPDIIHSHTDLPDFVLSLVLRLNKISARLVRTIHNTELWSSHHKIGNFVERKFNNDTIAAVSEAALYSYQQLRLSNNLKVSNTNLVIYNGCIVPKKQPHQFNIDSDKINIVYCGRFVYQKGTDILIKLIESISERYPNKFLFHIIGGGEQQKEVIKLTEKQNNVILYGEVPQMSTKLYPFDFLLMPSRFEGLPLVTIEASLSMLPVIASRIPGLIETLPPDWPLLFDLNNQKEALAIFDQIVHDSFNKKELQNKAFAFAQSRFSLQTMLDCYKKLYLL